MMPLPCSPVSNSNASESQSFPATSQDESDVSLTTPRPGPSDPAQRTDERLSRPDIAGFSSSPTSIAKDIDLSTSDSPLPPKALVLDTGSIRSRASSGPSSAVLPEKQRSVTFSHKMSSPKRQRIFYGTGQSPTSQSSPVFVSREEARLPHEEEVESSADETTAIFRRENAAERQYGAAPAGEQATDMLAGSSTTKKKTSQAKGKDRQNVSSDGQADKGDTGESWWKRTLAKYGSIELENKGSVARDHLALERTFLAWLRTSLSFASIGIAITQLFRLNTSLAESENDPQPDSSSAADLRQVGKPLGATFLGISIVILLLGFHRYFESQHYVVRGKFPASRGSIILVASVAGGLIIASLAVVLAIAPSAFET